MENEIVKIELPSTEVIAQNTQIAIQFYHLGPVNPSSANVPFWDEMAKMWRMTADEAKRQRCSNCEYYENTPEMMQAMEDVPQNEYDLYDGQAQRGYCHKLEFICHTSRTCSVWEKKQFKL